MSSFHYCFSLNKDLTAVQTLILPKEHEQHF